MLHYKQVMLTQVYSTHCHPESWIN